VDRQIRKNKPMYDLTKASLRPAVKKRKTRVRLNVKSTGKRIILDTNFLPRAWSAVSLWIKTI
jgi:hypothetical protein